LASSMRLPSARARSLRSRADADSPRLRARPRRRQPPPPLPAEATVPGRTSPTSASQRRDGRHAELRGTARERLLDAALAELRERGYEGSSLEAIARRAGLTRGAVYWNFHSKLELFVALLEQRVDGPARELMRLTETAPPETPTAGAVSHGLGRLV